MILLLSTGLATAQVHAGSICQPDLIHAHARVRHVLDGDTLILNDARHVRIIGMNTPEVGRKKRTSEPFADAARLRLIQLLGKYDNRVKLRYGKENYDRYGRLLAHVFAGDENVTEFMLRQGLAAQITVPPNTWRRDCYRRAEADARFKNRRIWRLPFYQYPPVAKLSGSGGFHLAQGNVTRVSVRGKKWRIVVSKRLTLTINAANKRYFDKKKIAALLGKRVFVRGWIRQRKKRLSIGLKHPDMLKVYPVACLRLSCRADQARAL